MPKSIVVAQGTVERVGPDGKPMIVGDVDTERVKEVAHLARAANACSGTGEAENRKNLPAGPHARVLGRPRRVPDHLGLEAEACSRGAHSAPAWWH